MRVPHCPKGRHGDCPQQAAGSNELRAGRHRDTQEPACLPRNAASEGLGGVTLPHDPGTAGGKGASRGQRGGTWTGGWPTKNQNCPRSCTQTAPGQRRPVPRTSHRAGRKSAGTKRPVGAQLRPGAVPGHLPALPACEGGPERPRMLSDTPGSAVHLACGFSRPPGRPFAMVAHGTSSSPPSRLGPGSSGQMPGCTHTKVLTPPNPPPLRSPQWVKGTAPLTLRAKAPDCFCLGHQTPALPTGPSSHTTQMPPP